MCSMCPSQKNDEEIENEKKCERTTCQTNLRNKKPPKPNRLCISSVKQRLSPPSKHFQRSLDQTPFVHKSGWFVAATRIFQRAEGRAVYDYVA